jgi:hypothetical protein
LLPFLHERKAKSEERLETSPDDVEEAEYSSRGVESGE